MSTQWIGCEYNGIHDTRYTQLLMWVVLHNPPPPPPKFSVKHRKKFHIITYSHQTLWLVLRIIICNSQLSIHNCSNLSKHVTQSKQHFYIPTGTVKNELVVNRFMKRPMLMKHIEIVNTCCGLPQLFRCRWATLATWNKCRWSRPSASCAHWAQCFAQMLPASRPNSLFRIGSCRRKLWLWEMSTMNSPKLKICSKGIHNLDIRRVPHGILGWIRDLSSDSWLVSANIK